MFEMHDRKLNVFAFIAVFMSYCPQFLGCGVIYKAHGTQFIFERRAKNSSFLHFRAVFMSLTVLGIRSDLQGP
jgi:hypothetical protein